MPMSFLSIIENKEIFSFMLNNEQWARLKVDIKYNRSLKVCSSKPFTFVHTILVLTQTYQALYREGISPI